MKTHSALLTHFPPPTFLSMPSVGMDISDRTIRFVELTTAGGSYALGRYGERPIPEGIVSEGKIADVPKMRELTTALAREEGIRFARVSLPEQHGYIVKMELPLVKKRDIRESLELQIEEQIPLSPANAVFDYELVPCVTEPIRHYDLGVTAMPKQVVEDYLAIFEGTGIMPLSFELEAQAIARAVLPPDCGTAMIVDVGGTHTGIFIISEGIIRYTTTVALGGVALTKVLAERLKLSLADAEKLKREKGLVQLPDNASVATTLLPMASSLQDEIKRHYHYWQTHEDAQDTGKKAPIERIVLCGGEGNVPGLQDYISRVLNIDVELANPWRNIFNFDEYIPALPHSQSLRYAAAIGLAMIDHES